MNGLQFVNTLWGMNMLIQNGICLKVKVYRISSGTGQKFTLETNCIILPLPYFSFQRPGHHDLCPSVP